MDSSRYGFNDPAAHSVNLNLFPHYDDDCINMGGEKSLTELIQAAAKENRKLADTSILNKKKKNKKMSNEEEIKRLKKKVKKLKERVEDLEEDIRSIKYQGPFN
jgi:predicted RNase H-like nuclease (RuvC/YqgF family)